MSMTNTVTLTSSTNNNSNEEHLPYLILPDEHITAAAHMNLIQQNQQPNYIERLTKIYYEVTNNNDNTNQ